MALAIPGTDFGLNWDAWHKAGIAPRFTITATGGTYLGDTSVAEQLYPYVKNLQMFLCPNDPTGSRFASGRWTPDKYRLTYSWQHAVGLGLNDCKPSGRPLTLAAIARPALLNMGGDNWTDMHTAGAGTQSRSMTFFADGHAKFALFLDGRIPQIEQRPRAWNYCNPHLAVNTEEMCQPDCKTVAAR